MNKLIQFNLLHQVKSCLKLIPARQTSNSAAYEGDGKTTVKVLNDEYPTLNMINTYSTRGFRLSNNLFVVGSILVFPTHVYSWNVRRGIDITPESLVVFDLIVPKIKMLVIGYGENGEPYDSQLPLLLKQKGISCEMLPTPHAVTTYNFMVSDAVHVAGAFVPVQHAEMTRRDIVAMHEYEELFKKRPMVSGRDTLDYRESVDEQYHRRQIYKREREDQKKFDD